MSILSWVLAGLVVGSLAGFLPGRQGILEDVIVAVVGSVIGGWLATVLAAMPVADLDSRSAIPAAAVAAGFVALSRAITRGRSAI